MTTPKVFISYSWTTPEHEEWVLQLATELVESGVDVILDKWFLKEGHDANAFMERMVSDESIDKVIIVCDKLYSEKADGRSGGVGTETQIISQEIYQRREQDKFVVIVAESNDSGKPYLPVYYKSRIYIDMSDAGKYTENFEKLIRWIYNKPLYQKPEIGKSPYYIEEESAGVNFGLTALRRHVIDSIRAGKESVNGALNEYFQAVVERFPQLMITDTSEPFDEKVINSIDAFQATRNDIIGVLTCIGQYSNSDELTRLTHRFFEQLLPFCYYPEGHGPWNEKWADNYRYIIHELFLYSIALFLKYEKFDAVTLLLNNRYYHQYRVSRGVDPMVSFADFCHNISSLDARNQRLNLNRYSLHSDILVNGCNGNIITKEDIFQADFTLFIRDCIDSLSTHYYQQWWPVSLLYLGYFRNYPFQIFARAESSIYFNNMKLILGIKSKDELTSLIDAFKEGRLRIPKWGFESFSPESLLGFNNLDTRQ